MLDPPKRPGTLNSPRKPIMSSREILGSPRKVVLSPRGQLVYSPQKESVRHAALMRAREAAFNDSFDATPGIPDVYHETNAAMTYVNKLAIDQGRCYGYNSSVLGEVHHTKRQFYGEEYCADPNRSKRDPASLAKRNHRSPAGPAAGINPSPPLSQQ